MTSKAGEFGQTEPYKSIFSTRTEKKRFTGIYGVRENRKLQIRAQNRPEIPGVTVILEMPVTNGG